MRPEQAIAAAIWSLYLANGNSLGNRGKVVEKVRVLKNEVPVTGVRVRLTPEGYASEEVSNYVGRLCNTGHVVQESPISLTKDGVELIQSLLRESYEHGAESVKEELMHAATVLGFSADVFSGAHEGAAA